jgi:hypothetical protein
VFGDGHAVIDIHKQTLGFFVPYRTALTLVGVTLQNGMGLGSTLPLTTAGGVVVRGSANFSGCIFSGNTMTPSKDVPGGGAVYVYDGSTTFVDCKFIASADTSRGHNDVFINDVDNSTSAIFACPGGTTGDPVVIKGALGSGTDLLVTQLPPAKKIVQCKPKLQSSP